MVFWRWNWFWDVGDNEMEFSDNFAQKIICDESFNLVLNYFRKFCVIFSIFNLKNYSRTPKHVAGSSSSWNILPTGPAGVFNSQLTPICWLYEFDSIRWSLSIFMIVCPCSRASSISINMNRTWMCFRWILSIFIKDEARKSIPRADHLMQTLASSSINLNRFELEFRGFFEKPLRRDLIW